MDPGGPGSLRVRTGLCVVQGGGRKAAPAALLSTLRDLGAEERNSLVLKEAMDGGLNSRDGTGPRTLEVGRSSRSLE